MEASKKQKKEILGHIVEISKMSLDQLRAFDEKWQMAKTDLVEVVYEGVHNIILS